MKILRKYLTPLNRVLWGLLVFSLPFTSFPFFYFPGMENAVVRPLSLYPLLILAVTLVLFSILSGEELPVAIGPLVFFIIAAMISTLLVFVEPLQVFRGHSSGSRAVRNLAALAFGTGYFLVSLLMFRDRKAIIQYGKLLYVVYFFVVAWSLLQAFRILRGVPDYLWMNSIHRLISVRDMHPYRVHGFAYEPSWFASQINILVLPLLWAGRLSGFRVLGRGRIAAILEWLLVIALAFVLGMSYSRGGALIGAAILAAGAILALILHLSAASRNKEAWFALKPQQIVFILIVLIILSVLILEFFIPILNRYDYFAVMWEKLFSSSNPINYLKSIGARPRVAYSESGYRIFLDHPVFGVGLGQAGFYMFEAMPNWVYTNAAEVIEILSPFSSQFPNPKNLWIGLLAETGIIGTSLFLLFTLTAFVSGLQYFRMDDRFGRFLGMFSVLSFMAILLSSYTLDSYATPNMWIAFGIMCAPAWPGFWRYREEKSE